MSAIGVAVNLFTRKGRDAEPAARRLSGYARRNRVDGRAGEAVEAQLEVAPVPQRQWSNKRERQYQHVKSSQQSQGRSEDRAEEIAARTVNKERARSGESRRKSSTSTKDISSGRRAGQRSGSGPGGRTKDQLYADAKRKGVKGRSTMNKAQLQRAVSR